MKLNKKESVIVDTSDWNLEIVVPTEDYTDVDDILIEAATMAVEARYHSSPQDFKIGAVVKTSLKKSSQFVKFINSYKLLCNAGGASMNRLAEDIRKNYLKASKVDLMNEPMMPTDL